VAATRNAARQLRSNGELDRLCDRARMLEHGDRADLVVDLASAETAVCYDDASLIEAVRHPSRSRTVGVTPLVEALVDSIRGFQNFAERGGAPLKRSRGRPAGKRGSSGNVVPLREAGRDG
jgi:hypothetical protein